MLLLVSGISSWNPLAITQQLISIVLSLVLIVKIIFGYRQTTKKTKADQAPSGLNLIAEQVVVWAENLIIELLGVKYKKMSIFLLYLLFYLGINNLLSVIGFESAVTSFTIPLSLGLVCFFGIYYFGLRYHRLSFFKKYLINPPEIIGQFVPLISISFRLFGNILGASIMTFLIVKLSFVIWGHIPSDSLSKVNLLAGVVLPIFNLYFDLFDGLVQTYIFSLLTFVYWSVEIGNKTDEFQTERYPNQILSSAPPARSRIARLLRSGE